ncbi:hypothetical protein [Pseudomonas sp. NFACC37-1]|uniref:hypothetical protein n=1 Tax=Pseudomonas sp. NFACC37-1 TaxID=1566196 RepID=UPI000887D8C8|nr:hypothetical protein [Pseudomonas sp. NFACC37-1]SCZ13261.1 hypothetical protein SAMN03159391_05804 [Pseudomonas sp. NFACC37-1]
MKSHILTLEHEHCVTGNHAVLAAVGGVPVVDSLDAASSYLESVVAGLRGLMNVTECTHEATLVYLAADAALALVYASHAGIEAAMAKDGAA